MPQDGRQSWIPQRSAGGIVIKEAGGSRNFLAIRPRGRDRWQLPKGIVEAGETPDRAALREVREEGGVGATILADVGSIHYFYRGLGRKFIKTVDFYLMRYEEGDPSDHDHEVEEAAWLPLEDSRLLSFSSERELVERAGDMFQNLRRGE